MQKNIAIYCKCVDAYADTISLPGKLVLRKSIIGGKQHEKDKIDKPNDGSNIGGSKPEWMR